MKKRYQFTKKQARIKRVRSKVRGTTDRPRLHVYRSNRYIYAQIINDQKGQTLAAASQKEIKANKLTKTQKSEKVGQLIAKKAKAKKVTKVRFDRGAYKYHGRIKALAEAARKEGLEF